MIQPAHSGLATLAATGSLPATLSPAGANETNNHGIIFADEIYYWNDVLLEAFRREGGGPGPLARAAAMMHAGILDTINSARWMRHPLGRPRPCSALRCRGRRRSSTRPSSTGTTT